MESWPSLGLNCAQLLGDRILGRIRYYFAFYFWLLEYETRVPVVISLCFFGVSLLVTKAPFHKKRDINSHHEGYFDYRRYHKSAYVGRHKFVGMDYLLLCITACWSLSYRTQCAPSHRSLWVGYPKDLGAGTYLWSPSRAQSKSMYLCKEKKKAMISTDWHILHITWNLSDLFQI